MGCRITEQSLSPGDVESESFAKSQRLPVGGRHHKQFSGLAFQGSYSYRNIVRLFPNEG